MTTDVTGTLTLGAKIANQTVASLVAPILEAYDMHSVSRSEIAVAAVDAALHFGGITTAKFLVIQSTEPISIKVNSSVTAIAGKLFVFAGAAITAVVASNSGENKAYIDVFAGGDA